MRFRNLTPHDVVVANGDLKLRIAKNPEDPIVRIVENVHTSRVHYHLSDGVTAVVPLKMHAGYSVHGLPEPEEGVIFIVSSMVASRVRRIDVVSPITDATCERGEDGHVISVKGFQTYDPEYGYKPATPSEPETSFDFEDDNTVEAEQETNEPDACEEVAAGSEEEEEPEAVEVPKVDERMLDPLYAAEQHRKHMKYLKRIGKYQKPGKRR